LMIPLASISNLNLWNTSCAGGKPSKMENDRLFCYQ
jgi:hypothetical protein